MVATVSGSFHIDFTFYVALSFMDLGTNHTVFLPIAEVLDVTTFRAAVSLVAAGCGVELCLGNSC